MKGFPLKLTINQKLATALLVLGAVGLFLGNPYRGARATIDATEMAEIVQKEVDHVSPQELADWIIAGKTDYRLIDLRNEKDYAEYHIPGAERMPITGLTDGGLMRNEKIVLYSEGGIHSAQAWFLLKADGYKGTYILRGGLEEWKDQVLFPALPAQPTPEQVSAFAKAKEVSKFFGGTPQSGAQGGSRNVDMPMPTVQMPVASAPQGGPVKKKKEGC